MAQSFDDQSPPASGGHDDGSVTVAELLERMSRQAPETSGYTGETWSARRARQATLEEPVSTAATGDAGAVMPPRRAQPQRVDPSPSRTSMSTGSSRSAAGRNFGGNNSSRHGSTDYGVTDYRQSADYRSRAGVYSQPLDTVSAADLAAADELMSWPDVSHMPRGTRGDSIGRETVGSPGGRVSEPCEETTGTMPLTASSRPRRSWILNDDDTQGFDRPTLEDPPASNVEQQYFITAGMDSLGPAAAEELEREIEESRRRYSRTAAEPAPTEHSTEWNLDDEWEARMSASHHSVERPTTAEHQQLHGTVDHASHFGWADRVSRTGHANDAGHVGDAGHTDRASHAGGRRVSRADRSGTTVNQPAAASAQGTVRQQGAKNRLRAAFHNLTKRDVDKEQITPADRILQIGQVVITAVAGGFLFWLFGILWGRPSLHILTFGLALAVQVVMVVAARLLRRREEFWVLIFTWAVAFFVTIGPIALVPR